MKIAHFSSSATGGAGTAAVRTVAALRQSGIDAELWTADQSGDVGMRSERWTKWRARIDRIPLRFYRDKKLFSVWSNNWQPSNLLKKIAATKPDIVHLHLIGPGAIDLQELCEVNVPLVWSMHDTWALAGGCHYPGECKRYEVGCGACPQLGSKKPEDLSRGNAERKRRWFRYIQAWVAPSQWMRKLALATDAFSADRVHFIPYGVDHGNFSPCGRDETRQKLGLLPHTFVLAVGATYMGEVRKGFALVPAALRQVALNRRCVVLLFGSGESSSDQIWPCPVIRMGLLETEQKIADVYRAADVLILPSLQDNLPNVALEALACGCPIVGFAPSGLTDIVEDGFTGKITYDRSSQGLAKALNEWTAAAPERIQLSKRCRAASEEKFTFPIHAAKITSLYDEVLSAKRRVPVLDETVGASRAG